MIELHNGYWAVEVPEDGLNFTVAKPFNKYWHINGDYPPTHRYTSWGCCIFYNQFGGKKKYPEKLEIVCTSKEASVAHAAKIIEEVEGGYKGYNYREDGVLFWREPIDSFYSLLTSNGCDVNKNYLIVNKTA